MDMLLVPFEFVGHEAAHISPMFVVYYSTFTLNAYRMQQRIFIVNPLGEAPFEPARQHWEEKHGSIFAALPGLLGYLQNRPLESEWSRGHRWVSSETWFTDRQTERDAFQNEYYLADVVADESTFLNRGSVWQSAIIQGASLPVQRSGYRVLWFGTEPNIDAPWEMSTLAHPAPGRASNVENLPAVLYTAWCDNPSEARRISQSSPRNLLVFACHTVSFTTAEG